MTGREAKRKGVGIATASAVVVVLILVPTLFLPVLVPASLPAVKWPAAPDEARVEYVREIRCDELELESGFLGRVLSFIGGKDPQAQLSRPFDVEVVGENLYIVCQELPALVRINQQKGTYRLFRCDDRPLSTPVSLAHIGETLFVSDSGSGAVYRLEGDRLVPWITDGLSRPTGIASISEEGVLCVIDTGDHMIKVYDSDGRRIREIGTHGSAETELNYPTFATEAGDGILVNDTLNYRVKRFDGQGRLVSSFGTEGDGPGAFARPKGLALDREGNTWVVDGLFDNIQIFDASGRLLLVIGGPGQAQGEFWSPVGIATSADEVFVADTYNDRIQVLQILGGGS